MEILTIMKRQSPAAEVAKYLQVVWPSGRRMSVAMTVSLRQEHIVETKKKFEYGFSARISHVPLRHVPGAHTPLEIALAVAQALLVSNFDICTFLQDSKIKVELCAQFLLKKSTVF